MKKGDSMEKYKAKYELLTSTFQTFVKDDTQTGDINPKDIEERKTFEADGDNEALENAQYIAYNMTKIINPKEFDGFAEVFLTEIKNNDKKIQIPKPGNHYADSALRKHLRLSGEDHIVEVVGMNSDSLYPKDFLTESGKRDKKPNPYELSDTEKIFFDEYLPFFNETRKDLNHFPKNKDVIMLPYSEKL